MSDTSSYQVDLAVRASSSMSPITPQQPKRARILACVLCQQRKKKCDRKSPCSNCIKVSDGPIAIAGSGTYFRSLKVEGSLHSQHPSASSEKAASKSGPFRKTGKVRGNAEALYMHAISIAKRRLLQRTVGSFRKLSWCGNNFDSENR